MKIEITKQWNGEELKRTDLFAHVELEETTNGMRFTASSPWRSDMRVPLRPSGRLDGLWDYDVVELFLVGEDGTYLEVELGAAGHYLVLAFDRVRHRSNEFIDRPFEVSHKRENGWWTASIEIPKDVLPAPIKKFNAFMIAGGMFLAYHPTPGTEPNFHQPKSYPDYVTP